MRDCTQAKAGARTIWKASSFTGLVLGKEAQSKMRAEAGCQHVDGDPPPPSLCGHSMFLSIGAGRISVLPTGS